MDTNPKTSAELYQRVEILPCYYSGKKIDRSTYFVFAPLNRVQMRGSTRFSEARGHLSRYFFALNSTGLWVFKYIYRKAGNTNIALNKLIAAIVFSLVEGFIRFGD